MLGSFLLGPGRGNVIPDSNRSPGSPHRAALATETLPSTRSQVSAKLKLSQISAVQKTNCSLIWPLAEMDAVMKGMVLFQRSLADTCMCALSSELVMDKYWLAVWTPHPLPHPLATLAKRHLTSASGKCLFFQHGKICYILCSFLLGIGRGSEIPGNNRILGSPWWIRNEGSSQHKVWRVCHTSAFPAFNIVKEALFIDLTRCKNGNWKENGSLTVVTGWHLHVCPFFSTGDCYELHCCTNAPSIGKTGKTLN